MRIKKLLSMFMASVLVITAFSLPVSAASSLTFLPYKEQVTYRLKVTASVDIVESVFDMGTTLAITSGKVLAGERITLTDANLTTLTGTIVGDNQKPTLNDSRISKREPLSFGYSSGTENIIIGGVVRRFTWVGYVDLDDNTQHPVDDLYFDLTSIRLDEQIVLDLPFETGREQVGLTNVTAEVVMPSAAKTAFIGGSVINVRDSFGDGRGFTLAQRSEISSSTNKNFTVTAYLDRSITDEYVLFSLTTDIADTSISQMAAKGASSVKFTIPKSFFYNGDYDIMFSWIKITGTSSYYNYSSIVLEYDSGTADVKDTTSDDSDSSDDDYDEELRINYTAVSLNVGASVNLTTNYDDVSWTTSSSKTVRAFASGKITAVKTGTATITGKNGNGDTVKCKVTVISSKTPVTALKLSKKSGTVYQNSSYSIGKMLSVSPSKHTDKITWSSDNTDIATVSSTGKVKVVGTGEVTITVTASSGKSASILLKCKKPIVKLSKKSATISVGKTAKIGVTSLPSASAITYDSYDEGVATVDEDGVVKGIEAGTAKIVVRNKNGASATFTVTVK